MLRFERLNEPSWDLLFLDPACERYLGQPAHELCSLVDSPYASLMEPQFRHQLHDIIQAELSRQGRYSVRYRLHTAQGAVEIVENGEVFRQYGRDLLSGYLMICPSAGACEVEAQHLNL